MRDIAGILQVSGSLLDRESLRQWAHKLDVNEELAQVLKRVDALDEQDDVDSDD